MLQKIGEIIKGLTVLSFNLGHSLGKKVYWKTVVLSVKFDVARDEYRIRKGLPKIPRVWDEQEKS